MGDSLLPDITPVITDPVLERHKFSNFLKLLRQRRTKQTVVSASPIHATIDLTTACNLRCPYCATGNGTIERAKSILRPEKAAQMTKDLYDPMFLAAFFSTGEPLLNKWFAEIIQQASTHSVFSTISTNLSNKLSDSQIDSILLSGLGLLSASIDGTNAESYNRYRVGGDYSLVMDNLRRFILRKRYLGLDYPLIEWRFLVFQHNQNELELAEQMALELGVDLLEFYPGVAPVDAQEPEVRLATNFRPATYFSARFDRIRKQQDRPLQRYLRHNFIKDEDRITPNLTTAEKKCDWLTLGTMLFPNGAVSPCCVSNDESDDFGVVDEKSSFKDVWNNDFYQSARSIFVKQPQKVETICSRCPIPSAQHFQFRNIIRSILRITPEWALRIICQDPDSFFFNVDRDLMQDELEPIFANRLFQGELSVQPGIADKLLQDL